MKGDFSRRTFDRARHYSGVRMQQGRVLVDADWNEQSDIIEHRIRTGARDLIGRCGGPAGHAGFRLIAGPADLTAAEKKLDGNGAPWVQIDEGDLLITAGRYYAGGRLVENEHIISLSRQPDLPPTAATVRLEAPGRYLAYLDVWERHITALDDPAIREVALGGPDTTTRSRTIWQVKLLRVDGDAPMECAGMFPEFDEATARGTGRISARTEPAGPNDDPCSISPEAGYRGLENQFYRVEVHNGGDALDAAAGGLVMVNGITPPEVRPVKLTLAGPVNWAAGQPVEIISTLPGSDPMGGTLAFVEKVESGGTVVTLNAGIGDVAMSLLPAVRRVDATYKWSRDNGSVVTTIEKIDGERITVHDLGPDSVLGFAPEQWVEIADDVTELNGLPGQLVQISSIDPARRIITLKSSPTALDAGKPDGVDPVRHPRLRRWDGVGAIRFRAVGDGVANLESGIQVRFTAGSYRSGDYWTFAARTSTADEQSGNIDWPRDAAGVSLERLPFGIRHHYCRIAMVTMMTVDDAMKITAIDDCRCLFQPVTALRGFFYVGGDGQEARPGLPMPQPLQVGVFNVGMSDNCAPVAGVRVQFTTADDGLLAAGPITPGDASIARTFTAVTDASGVATVHWRPEANQAKPSQTVEARLLGEGDVPQMQVVIFNGQLSIASEVAYTPGDCAGLQGAQTVQEALDRLCRGIGTCHDFLDELRSDGVVRNAKGMLGLRVSHDEQAMPGAPSIRYEPGVAYVDGCRHVVVLGGRLPVEPSTIGQWVVVNRQGMVEVLLEPLPPEHCALLAIVSTYEGAVERIVDVRRDMTHLDEQVEDDRHGIAASRRDAREYVPLLAGTISDLRYRDRFGNFGYRDGRNRWFDMPAIVSGVVFDGRMIWAAVESDGAQSGGFRIVRMDRYATEVTSDDLIDVDRRLLAGVFDGASVWFTGVAAIGGSLTGSLLSIDAVTLEQKSMLVEGVPFAIMFDGHFIWVTTAAGTLLQIDVERNRVVRVLTLRDKAGAAIQPLALEFDGEYIWVTGTGRMLYRIQKPWGDPEPVVVTGQGNQPPLPEFHQLAFDGSHLWLQAMNGDLYKLDVLTSMFWPVEVPIRSSQYGGLVFDGSYMWVMVNQAQSNAIMYKIDARTDQAIGSADLVRTPSPIGALPLRLQTFDGTHVWYPYQYQGAPMPGTIGGQIQINGMQKFLVV